MKSLLRLISVWICLYCIVSYINANETESFLKEVTQTDTVYLQEKGEIEITTSPNFTYSDNENLFIIPLEIEYGISDKWEAELEWETFILENTDAGDSTSGAGDLIIGTQYSFLNINGSDFHIAPGLELHFPTADIDKELTDGFIIYKPYLFLAQDIPEWNFAQLFTQFGIEILDRIKKPDEEEYQPVKAHELNLDIGFIIPVKEIIMSLEFNWENNKWNNNGDKNEIYLTPGLFWELADLWELSIELPVGINEDAEDYQVIITITYEFDFFDKGKE